MRLSKFVFTTSVFLYATSLNRNFWRDLPGIQRDNTHTKEKPINATLSAHVRTHVWRFFSVRLLIRLTENTRPYYSIVMSGKKKFSQTVHIL